MKINDYPRKTITSTSSVSSSTSQQSPKAKRVLLDSSIHTTGRESSGKSIILDGQYNEGKKASKKVKVKLVKMSEEEMLNNEFEIAEALYEGSPGCFIKVYGLLYGNENQITPCEDCDDDLTNYVGLVMVRIYLFKFAFKYHLF